MKKIVVLDNSLVEKIQKYANENCDGNFSMAFRMIARQFFDSKAESL